MEIYCHKVYYYKREQGFNHTVSTLPYIVKTRQSEELLQNLLTDDDPVLFEGLHTTAYLNHESLKSRIKIVRTHNVEHDYYAALAQSEKKLARKIFFKTEAAKLKAFEPVLHYATSIAAISKNDFNYFNKKYKNVIYIPAFHPYNIVKLQTDKGDYVLFHGDLSTGENIISCLYLIKNIFSKLKHPVMVAGKNPHESIVKQAKKYGNIKLIPNPGHDEMNRIISGAHISVLYTFQDTGMKLKLLASLFNSRHCIANNLMVKNTGLEDLCSIRNTPEEIIDEINVLMKQPFEAGDAERRNMVLSAGYSNVENAEKLRRLINKI